MLCNRHARLVLQAVVVAAVVAGCGNQDVTVPVECLEGPRTVAAALKRAPGDVRLEGRVRISACFKHAANAADVQNLGGILLESTQRLTARVRRAPQSHAAVELGYRVGAVRRGARTDTGVHYESERRVEQELIGVPTGTPEFRRGLEAGRRAG